MVGVILGCAQDLLAPGFVLSDHFGWDSGGHPYAILGIKTGSTRCQASAFTSVLTFQLLFPL